MDILPSHRGGRLPSVKEIAALGVTRIRISQPMHLIQAWVPIDKLHALAALHRVGWVRVPTYALVEPPPGTYPRLPTPNRQATKPKGVPDTSSTPSHTKDAGGVNPGALGILALILFFRRFHESIAVGSWNHEPTDA